MSNIIHVREYQRRKPERRRPEKSPQYRALNNRLYDEVMFLQVADRCLEEELAMQIEADLEGADGFCN
jgi:hypothetical protein